MNASDSLLHNGTITTLDPDNPQVSAVTIGNGRISRITAIGSE